LKLLLPKIGKEPWLAVNLSLFFPGIGQIYAGEYSKGMSSILIQIGLIAMAFWSIYDPQGSTVTAIFCGIFLVTFYLANLFDAYYCIDRTRKSKTRDPWYAVFLSRIMPGLGHLYLQKPFIAVFFLSISVIFGLLDDSISWLLIATPVIKAIALRHAYFCTPQSLAEARQKQQHPTIWLALLMLTIVVFGVIDNQLPDWLENKIERFIIPSSSMSPTLQINDRILVEKFDRFQPAPGDIVVFRVPEATKKFDLGTEADDVEFYIKRVIAIPGQSIAVNNGRVYVDRLPLNEPYLDESPSYEWETEIVPQGYYCVLGDNRNDSFDSHVWGFLPETDLVGKAYKIYWPPERIRALLD
jgi:signal peptidase I